MFRIVDIFGFTLERIRQHLVLVFWVLLGIYVAITLALSLPLYVDSVYSGILSSRLDDPPYAFRFRYLGAWEGNISVSDAQTASAAIENRFVEDINLPVNLQVRYLKAGNWNARLAANNAGLGNFGISSLTGVESQITIVDGEWPPNLEADDERIPVLLPEVMLFQNGVQVGDEIIAQRAGGQAQTMVVAAMWRANNINDPAWIFPPDRFFNTIMLVEPQTLINLVEGIEDPIDEVAWYLLFDGSDLLTSQVDMLLAAIASGTREIDRVLPGIDLNVSPEVGLRAFSSEVALLTQQLFIIIMPVGGLILYFVSLVSGLLVSRQRGEDVKLRSRGMSRANVLALHVLMWFLIVGAALVLGVLTSPYVVALIGRTASFLNFTGVSSVQQVVITPEALLIGAVTGLITASSGLLLAWRITRQNINDYKQSFSQTTQAWWQRTYLDLLLLLPAGYVLYTLLQNEGLATDVDTPFADPLTFIGPTLFALGMTLLVLRILPLVFGVCARLLSLTSNIALLMAFREVTRSIGRYRGTLLMTAFTLSLTGFTASMASTLDSSLVDVINYRVGADLVLVTAADAQTETQQDTETGQATTTVTGYNAPPILELQNIAGINTFSRIGEYNGRLSVQGQRLNGTILGVDRGTLASIARMRDDFTDEQFAALLNRLAGQRTGILLSKATAEQYGILIGQEVRYQVQALGEWQSEVRAPVLGLVDYFPTLDPAGAQFFLLTSIDPIFEVSGTFLPFNIWLDVNEQVSSVEEVLQDLRQIQFPILRTLDPQTQLEQAQAEPARRGVLGFLSIGFVASVLLTLIGSLIQSTASFRAQASQLASLRAMGLRQTAVFLYIMVVQTLNAASGILSGTAIGVATTLLYLPLLDFSGGLPPYQVNVAWGEITTVYLVFAGTLFAVTLMISLVMSREQLATAVKVGNF